MNRRSLASLLLALVLLLSLPVVGLAQDELAVEVGDQPVVDGTVTVDRVVSSGPGWIVIHADADGRPGPVLGQAAVEDGVNTDVEVEIDTADATPLLHAMLHVDEGTVGTYEFPGADVPARVDDTVVVTAFSTEEAMGEEMGMGDIVDTAMANDQFSTLVAALQAAGLAEALRSEGPYTVFAPTNDAFDALPEGTLEELLADPAGDLTQILLYHVVPGRVTAADVTDGLEAFTLQGSPVTFTVEDDQVMVNDATVIATDVEASNGIIHVIDAVLIPPIAEGEVAEATPTPADEAEATPTPVDEEEATPEPMEEAEATPTPVAEQTPAATPEPMGEADATPGAKGGAPQAMPTTGASIPSGATSIAVVLVVLAVVIGGTVVARRRNLY